jgi:hypothetical protein
MGEDWNHRSTLMDTDLDILWIAQPVRLRVQAKRWGARWWEKPVCACPVIVFGAIIGT